MLKLITAVVRPAGQSQAEFVSSLVGAARASLSADGTAGAIVSEVVGHLRGDLAADGFVETWWHDEIAAERERGDWVGLPPGATRWVGREHVLKRPHWTSDPDARKVLGTAYRRDDFTPEAFFRYWREVHAPVSSRAAGLGGYVVTEVLSRVAGGMAADAFVEQWWPDQATLDAAGASEEVAIAWEDVANYAKTTGTFWTVREHVLAAPTYEAPGLLEV